MADDGEVQARKRRLAELKDKAAKMGGGVEGGVDEGGGAKMRFRNYQPYDASLAAPEQVPEPAATAPQAQAKAQAKTEEPLDVIQKELEELKGSSQQAKVVVVPKKPNWDLQSQVAERLERLQRRTQRAIVEILREKLANQQDA